MFERFTDGAHRALVLAQEEARLLGHNHIGTEHILLGLVHEGDGVAAQALGSLGISLETLRQKVEETIGPAGSEPGGPPPFTPRAKRALELSLREALHLGCTYIGTEHILLGLVREGEGVAARALVQLGVDLSTVRQSVLTLLNAGTPTAGSPTAGTTAAGAVTVGAGTAAGTASAGEPAPGPRCRGCGSDLARTARYHYLEVPPDEGAPQRRPLSLLVVYCSQCGAGVGGPGVVSADVALPGGRPAVTVARRWRPGPGPRVAGSSQPSFPAELLGAVNVDAVPAAERVSLTARRQPGRDGLLVEGTVCGGRVQLELLANSTGWARGIWDGAPLEVSWGVPYRLHGRDPFVSLRGHFGGDDVRLDGIFRLQQDHLLSNAQVEGHIGSAALTAKVVPATGGFGSTSTVVAEGSLGATELEVWVALTGDATRAAVRGSVGEGMFALDVSVAEVRAVFEVSGGYEGPPALLALTVGAVLSFL